MEQQRIGIFRRIFLAVTDFRLYPYVVKERTTKAIGYFFKLMFICSILLSFYFMTIAQDFINEELVQLEKKVPDFTVIDGELVFSGDAQIEISPMIILDMKNDYSENVPIESYPDDKIYIVVTKDLVRAGNSRKELLYPPISFKEVTPLNKAEMLSNIKLMNDDFAMKAYFYSIILVATFIYYFISRVWMLLMYIMALLVFDGLFGVKLRARDFLKLSIYISTFPIILEIFAICIGSKYNPTANFISFLIAMVYAFYALRAMRLDAIMTSAIGDTPEEKIENAIKNAQEELERQLKEIEREAEKRDLKELEEKEKEEKEEKEKQEDEKK